MATYLPPAERDFYKLVCDPVRAIPALFDFHLWGKQAEIVQSVHDNERTLVHACHSSGKTAIAARLVPWWLARYPEDGKVITTAPTDNQVKRALWGEVHSAIRAARQNNTIAFPEPNLTELRLSEHWWAYGFSTNVTRSDEGVRFQGFHGGHMLFIFDEAIGIHPAIWTALEGVMSSGHVRFLGLMNPTVPSGPAYDACKDPAYNVIHVSAFDTPNFTGLTLEELVSWKRNDPRLLDNLWPALLSRKWVYDRYYAWGPNHPHFQSRVMGNFPSQSKYALFALSDLREAIREETPRDNEVRAVGIDVAGSGDNETVVILRSGARILGVWGFSDPDPRGVIMRLLESFQPVDLINVDATGIGYNFGLHIADEYGLLEDGGIVQQVNVGAKTYYPDRFANLKAELYWSLSDLLKTRTLSIAGTAMEHNSHAPDIVLATADTGATCGQYAVDLMIGQLAGLQYQLNPNGRTAMESKQQMATRGVASPDYAEAAMLSFVPNLLVEQGVQQVSYYDDRQVSRY